MILAFRALNSGEEHSKMDCMLTVVAPDALEDAVVGEIRKTLRAGGASLSPTDWLAPGRVCDIAFEGLDPRIADARARAAAGDSPLDLFCQPANGRRKRLLVADMDSTVVTTETLDELAAYAGVKERVSLVTARAMRGELNFEEAVRERVAMLSGTPETALLRTWEAVALTEGARILVQTMRANGACCILASGGFDFFAARVADACGFHDVCANRLEIFDGVLTGRVVPPVLGGGAKAKILASAAGKLGIALSQAAAVGDGANDVNMLCAAGLGAAFHAKPLVRQAAPFRIDHNDLSALLFAQGYRQSEFAA